MNKCKKVLAVLAVLFAVGSTKVFATGLGVQGGYNPSGFGGAAVTFKLDNVPCVFAADLGISSSYFNIGLTADWWIANPKIEGTWGWYYGVGLAGTVKLANNSYGGVGFGPRALIGTNVFLFDGFLELYAQAAYQPMVWIWANKDDGGIGFDWISIPLNIGFRVWF